MTTDAIGVQVVDQARRDLGALPLPAACGERAPQAPAPPACKPDEPARAAYFPLTRVTRIFQKSVLTKSAPAHERRGAGVPNATSRRRKGSPGEFHCFQIVIYNGWRNACVCRPSWPGE